MINLYIKEFTATSDEFNIPRYHGCASNLCPRLLTLWIKSAKTLFFEKLLFPKMAPITATFPVNIDGRTTYHCYCLMMEDFDYCLPFLINFLIFFSFNFFISFFVFYSNYFKTCKLNLWTAKIKLDSKTGSKHNDIAMKDLPKNVLTRNFYFL